MIVHVKSQSLNVYIRYNWCYQKIIATTISYTNTIAITNYRSYISSNDYFSTDARTKDVRMTDVRMTDVRMTDARLTDVNRKTFLEVEPISHLQSSMILPLFLT